MCVCVFVCVFRERERESFPGGSDGKEPAGNAGDLGAIPGLRKSPRREWKPTPVFLTGEFHGQRSLGGCSTWTHKELDTTERLTYIYIYISVIPIALYFVNKT